MKEWRPNPGSQEKALQSSVFELFYGGAAGGGKSAFLLIDVLGQISNPNYRAILFRKTYPDLERSLILESMRIYGSFNAKYNGEKHRWTFPSGASIDFGHMDTLKDVYNYQGAQYAYLGFDEATHFTEFQIEYVKSRCRSDDPTLKKYIRYASNPGNIGHAYFKKRFIEGKIPYKVYRDEKTGLTMQFIPSRVYDNLVLMAADPEYVKRLEGLPETERRMLLEGDWDVFAGQFFDEWRIERHVCEPFAIPDNWKRCLAIDHGRTAPTAALWGAVDQDGNIWFYREYYKANEDADINAMNIARLTGDEKLSFIVLDSACFSKTGSGETIAEIYQRNGVNVIPSSKGRMAGWALMHEYLRWQERGEERQPKMKFFDTCVNSIRTIPIMIHDSRKPEDLDTSLDDHCADSASYFLQALHEGQSDAAKDPIQRMMDELKKKSSYNPNNLNKFYSNRLK